MSDTTTPPTHLPELDHLRLQLSLKTLENLALRERLHHRDAGDANVAHARLVEALRVSHAMGPRDQINVDTGEIVRQPAPGAKLAVVPPPPEPPATPEQTG